jgi:methylthioribulose-1-phosphate dehydratase
MATNTSLDAPAASFVLQDRPVRDLDDGRALICELGRRFYERGWVSGTGGGVALRVGERILMAPSGVQKELLRPDMMFELDGKGEVARAPDDATLKVSQCRPLFLAAMELRGAGAVIHTHSKHAVMATLSFGDRVTLSRLEMMKGLRGVGYDDTHEVPIIENTAHECDLHDSLVVAMRAFPKTHAVLVRRHGMYVWGEDWREAKRHAECYDYLLDIAVEMRRLPPMSSPADRRG